MCIKDCNFVGTSFEFEVKYSYIRNDIILLIIPSSDGTFCCQLDRGTCIHCEFSLIKCIIKLLFC